MVAFDWQKTAESLRPHDFELLVRAYCKRMAWRVRSTQEHGREVQTRFEINFDREGKMADASWRMCIQWGEDTRGEILDGVADELVRRESWKKSPQATLRQIEG